MQPLVNNEERKFLIGTYDVLDKIDSVINELQKMDNLEFKVSVLEKINGPCNRKKMENSKKHWKRALKGTFDFGCFANEQLGFICAIGPVSKMFLQPIGTKNLGTLSEGPYSILRGLGMDTKESTESLKKLNQCHFLLLVRVRVEDGLLVESILRKAC